MTLKPLTTMIRNAGNFSSLIFAGVFSLVSIGAFSQNDTVQKIIPGRSNSVEQQTKPYVILISADGFRWDLADKYHATHLLQLRDSGVAASFMQPSFPSLLFLTIILL